MADGGFAAASKKMAIFAICAMSIAAPVRASVIVVDSLSTYPYPADDCSIASAFNAALTRTQVGTCPAGSGVDVIVLPENATFSFTQRAYGYADDPAALPDVDSDLWIVGNGATLGTTQSCDLSTVPPPTDFFRLFAVKRHGRLALSDLTLAHGCMLGYRSGGALAVYGGSLTLDRVVVRDSVSDKSGGGIYVDYGGSLAMRDTSFTGNSAGYGDGGALYSAAGATIESSYFSGNSASEGSAAYSEWGRLSIVNSTFERNIATTAAVSGVGETEISFSTFDGNVGGAITFGEHVSLVGTILSAGRGGQNGENCRWGTGSTAQILTVLGPTYSDDPSCPGVTVVDRSDLSLGDVGAYGGATPTIPLLPGSVAIDHVPDCASIGGPIDEDQRGSPRPSVYAAGCDAGSYEFDGIDHSPPQPQFGAGNVLLGFEQEVIEYTRQGQRVREMWYPRRAPSDYAMRGVDALGIDAYQVYLGRFDHAVGHYAVGPDRWTFADPAGWADNPSAGAVAHVGSRVFVSDNQTSTTTGRVLVLENGEPVGELPMVGMWISDVSAGRDGSVYVLGSSGPDTILRKYDPATLLPAYELHSPAVAALAAATQVAAGRDGTVYVANGATAPLVAIDAAGNVLRQTDCVVVGNIHSCGGMRDLAVADDGVLVAGTTDGYLVVLDSDFSSGSGVAIAEADFGNGFTLSPLPTDELFQSSFER